MLATGRARNGTARQVEPTRRMPPPPTLIQACRLSDVGPPVRLDDVTARISHHPQSHLLELALWAWKPTRAPLTAPAVGLPGTCSFRAKFQGLRRIGTTISIRPEGDHARRRFAFIAVRLHRDQLDPADLPQSASAFCSTGARHIFIYQERQCSRMLLQRT